MKTKLIRSLAPFSAWKYSSLSFCRRQQFTKLWQFWSVIKYGGGGFQFIWFHSGNRIMNRLFASLPPKLGWRGDKRQNDGDKKRRHTDKRLSQRQSGSFGRLHLEKGTKNGAKPGKVAKNGSSTSKLIRKVLWIGAHCTELTSSSGPFGFSSGCALRAHWSGGLAGVWAQLGGKKTFCHGQMFFAAPPAPVFGSGGVD